MEDASSGIQLSQNLRRIGKFNLEAFPVAKSKEERVYLHRAKFDAGRVHFLKGIKNLDIAERELTTFPQARTDDIVDSIVQALGFEKFGYDRTLKWVTG